MLEWIKDNTAIVWTFAAASVLIFLGSLVAVPLVVSRINADYFNREKRPPSRWANSHRAVRILLRIGKNALGVVFVIAGLAMLVLPGQGLLTLLMGVLLIEFPGKYRFEKWLVRRPFVRTPVNWLRNKAGRPPLQLDGGA